MQKLFLNTIDSQVSIILTDCQSASYINILLLLVGEKDLPIIPLARTDGKFNDVFIFSVYVIKGDYTISSLRF